MTGASYPGVPFVIVSGRTQQISWSLTPSAVDTADLFKEQIRVKQEDGGEVTYQYLHSRESSGGKDNGEGEGDVWKPAILRREVITARAVKRQASPSTLMLDCLQTERGVVLPPSGFTSFAAQALHRQQHEQQLQGIDGQPPDHYSWLSLASVDRLHPLRINSWLQLNTARSWTDFNKALEGMYSLSWNALYADTSNNIGSRITGRYCFVSQTLALLALLALL